MSRFNTKVSPSRNKTTNLAGGKAYKETSKLELVSIMLTSFVTDQFYRKATDTLGRFEQLIQSVDPLFAAKLAVYARYKMSMRSITHVATANIAYRLSGSGNDWTRKFVTKVINRVDDAIEILAYYRTKFPGPIPNALKRGIADSFCKFDGYQLAKYKMEGKDFKLVDVVNLVHPKPTEKNAEALRLLVEGKLVSTGTYEAELSKAGQEEDAEAAKGGAWRKLVSERKIGYFALLRNLRNIVQQAPDLTDAACEMLTEEKLIRKSLVLPFRFLAAFKELEKVSGTNKVLAALSKAVDLSLKNVPKLPGDTCVIIDTSGSMTGGMVAGGQTSCMEVASIFAAVLAKANDADLVQFSDQASYMSINTADSTMGIARMIQTKAFGGGTSFHAPLRLLKRKYDRLIYLSDMQGWIEGYATPYPTYLEYCKRTGCNPNVFSFDLAGYGTLQFPQEQIYCLAGFSDASLKIMGILEQDRNALIKEIEAVEF